MTVIVPRVIRTSGRRKRMLSDGRISVSTVTVIDVPATDFTFHTNCVIIAGEMVREGIASAHTVDAVEELCRRILATSDGGRLA